MEAMRAHLEREAVIEEEVIEWAELYPHVRGLLNKNWRARLEAFEEFRRAVVSRLTGGIEELDQLYKLAQVSHSIALGSNEWRSVRQWIADSDHALSNADKAIGALDVWGVGGAARSYFVDTFRAECVIRGFHVLRLTSDANDVLLAAGRTTRQVDRFNRVIARLGQLSSKGVVIVLDGIEHLSDDAASFIRYLSTRYELRSDSDSVLLFAIVRRWRSPHPLDSYLPEDRQIIDLRIDNSTVGEKEPEAIRASVLASAALKGKHSDSRRRLIAYVAAHPAPLPTEWVEEFLRLSTARLIEDLDPLLTAHLISRVVVRGAEVLIISEDARAPILEVVSARTLAEAHRDLAARLILELGSPNNVESSLHDLIAYHYGAIGEHRLAFISRIKALKAAWREGQLSTVERLARLSLGHLREENDSAEALRRHFVKQWVMALWLRNKHAHAKQVIEEHLVARGISIPPGLLTKYARGIMDTDGPAPAMTFVKRGIAFSKLSKSIAAQVLLEKALLLCQSANHHASLDLLEQLNSSGFVSGRDRHRLVIYRAMNLSGLGEHGQVEDLLVSSASRAHADGCNDEFVLMCAIRAQMLNIRGKPRESLRLIARTLPIAHRHELYLRLNLLYRLAAASYQDLGLPWRSVASQRKAIELASTLGLRQFEAVSWSRLAEYERVVGNFGNTLRYLDKAASIIATSTYEADRAKLCLTVMQIHLWLRSPELESVVKDAFWVEHIKDANLRGRFCMLLGNYLTDKRDWKRASRYYQKAEVLLRRTGYMDHWITLRRSRLRFALRCGLKKQASSDFNALKARDIRTEDAPTSQLERTLGLLEFAFHNRSHWNLTSGLCDASLAMCGEATDAMYRFEALPLLFRLFARKGRYADAEHVFARLHVLLKSTTSNLEDRYVSGLMDRIELSVLAREYEQLQRRKRPA